MQDLVDVYSSLINEDNNNTLDEMYVIDNWYNKVYSINNWKNLNLSKDMVSHFVNTMYEKISSLEKSLNDTSWFDGTNEFISDNARILNKKLHEQDEKAITYLTENLKNLVTAYKN